MFRPRIVQVRTIPTLARLRRTIFVLLAALSMTLVVVTTTGNPTVRRIAAIVLASVGVATLAIVLRIASQRTTDPT